MGTEIDLLVLSVGYFDILYIDIIDTVWNSFSMNVIQWNLYMTSLDICFPFGRILR